MAMEQVGVEMVVTGLQSFLGDMKKADSSIQGLIPTSGLLGGALTTLGNIATSVGNFIANTLAHAIGELLADAVEWAVSQIQELITSAIEAGDQFQALKIRLNQMNFNTASESAKNYSDAMATAIEQTKDQLLWIQQLATATPFELSDVTQVYSMARSYSFADDEARNLVETLSDFTAGMGLGGAEMVNIIRQFGQMRNTGKILQKDLNSLAEGGMVPVNKILDIMKEKTGLTGKAFDEFKLSAAGAKMFLETFTNFVKDNYEGAAEKANRTFKNATITLKEFFTSFAASNVVTPILDVLGEKISSLNDALSARLPDIISGFDRIGKVLASILTDVLGLGPSADEMANTFVSALSGIADWLETHKGDIVAFIETAVQKVTEWKNAFLGTDQQPGFLEKAYQTFLEMQPLVQPIKDLFSAIGEVAGAALGLEFGDLSDKSFAETVQSVANGIKEVAKWISENKESIAYWVTKWAEGAAALLLVSVGLTILLGIAKELIFVFVGWAAEGNNWINILLVLVGIAAVWGAITSGAFAMVAAAILAVPLAVVALIAAIAILVYLVYQYGAQIVATWVGLHKQLVDIMKNLGKALVNKWFELRDKVVSVVSDFIAGLIVSFVMMGMQILTAIVTWVLNMVGKFNELKMKLTAAALVIKDAVIAKFNDLKNGVINAVSNVADSVKNAMQGAIDTIAKMGFWNAGVEMMKAVASGVSAGAGLLYDAVKSAAQNAWNSLLSTFKGTGGTSTGGGLSPGGSGSPFKSLAVSTNPGTMTTSSVSSVSTTNNYNLYINSSAPIEPLVADFQMMKSLGV